MTSINIFNGLLPVICVLATVLMQASALSIDCEFAFKGPGHWKLVNDAYTCYIRNIDVTKKELVTDIKGDHEGSYTKKDLKALNIYGKVCHTIPAGFDAFFENVEAFSVTESSLKTVTSNDLKQFPKLREIWLYNNNLEFLPSNLFEHNPNVEYISFKVNKIRFVGSEFFNHLPKLSKASFYSNICIDKEADDSTQLDALKKDIFDGCSYAGASGSTDLLTEYDTIYKGNQAASAQYVEYLQYRVKYYWTEIQKYQKTSGCKLE